MRKWTIGFFIAALAAAPATAMAAQPAPSAPPPQVQPPVESPPAAAIQPPAAPAPPGPPPAGTYVIHAIDVGTGLAIFVEGHDFALLYDAGSNDDAGRDDKNRVVAYLAAVRPDLGRIDHLVVSHPHKDHHEMLDDVFERYEVGHVWDSGSIHTSCGYRVYLEA
ncbi:MAG TPA: MBL fold metallo-hydrolase, partial [Allosphingosinicella sp.]|nr:MBL fold metallo-hydrolase [Allosphingosinicella sp.]